MQLGRWTGSVPGLPDGRPAMPLAADAETAESALPLSHYVWIIRRNAIAIGLFIAAVVAATVAISLRLTPIYEATATVFVDRQEAKNIVGRESESSSFSGLETEQLMVTQMRMIQSDSVVRPIADRYGLREREKQFGDDRELRVKAADSPILLKQLRVSRPPNTYLIQISYRATDPQLAADVANGIAASYIDHTYNIRTKSSVSLARYMERQIEELRAKMEGSSARLARMERDLNVINPEEKTNILSARLLQLNSDYTKAQAERVHAQTEYDAIRGGSLDAALTSSQAESLKRLLDRRNEVNQNFAEIRTHFGPNHPEFRKIAAQARQIEVDIEEMRGRIANQAKVRFAEAQQREGMLRRGVEETKAEYDRLNLNSFDYRRVKQEADADKKLYDELVRKIREAGINASFQNNTVRVSDPARPAWKPVFPKLPLNILLALLFSAVLAVGAAILADTLDNTIRDPDQVTRSLQTTVIGTLPAVKEVASLQISSPALEAGGLVAPPADRQISTYDEAIRTLRSSILLTDFDRRIRTLLLSSATAGEGKSTTSAHLAYTHAEQRKPTLLIDCDLRRPSQHKIFGVPSGTGLSSVVNEELSWREARVRVPANPQLHLITAGPPSRRAADMIGAALPPLLEEMGKEYDLIVLDGPPLLGFAESLQMAAAVDGVILVTRAGDTSRKAVGAALQTLHQLRVNVVGLVLNQVKRSHSDHYYYYGYYGSYYKQYAASPSPSEAS